jgi:hypothetical protein
LWKSGWWGHQDFFYFLTESGSGFSAETLTVTEHVSLFILFAETRFSTRKKRQSGRCFFGSETALPGGRGLVVKFMKKLRLARWLELLGMGITGPGIYWQRDDSNDLG